jgi:hypothetical protein
MTVTPVMARTLAGASSARAGSAPARAAMGRQAVSCLAYEAASVLPLQFIGAGLGPIGFLLGRR